MTIKTRPLRARIAAFVEDIGKLLPQEDAGFLIGLRDTLERRALYRPPPIDRAAIAEEVDAGFERYAERVQGARESQGVILGPDLEAVRVVVYMERADLGDIVDVCERDVVGRLGIARALAIEAVALAESFGARFPEMEARQ